MSKKKRARRENQQEVEFAEDNLEFLKQKAVRFFESASPFEISCELTRRGVTTAHREGIFNLLDADFQTLDSEKIKDLSERHSDRFLALTWRREIEEKGREPSVDDLVFLMVAALRFSLKWSESRLALSNARLAELEAEVLRRDKAPPNA